MFEKLLRKRYALHLYEAQRASADAGSDTWLLRCAEGDFVMKFPAPSAINHPEAEPQLCEFLWRHGIPACEFLKNDRDEYITADDAGRSFTVQRRFPGETPEWNTASEELLTESAELLGRIHAVLQEYPALPEGIGAGFFASMTPQRARQSYLRSLETAVSLGDTESAEELRWRIGFMERLPAWRFDLDRLTRRSTHGDYFISQFLCENGHLSAVIDWTTACVHPVIWEIMRSFVYAAPGCAGGKIDGTLLDRYVGAYCRYGTLNGYDRENLYRLYIYQIAVCDYYGQYFASRAAHREIYRRQARLATAFLKETADAGINY